MSNNPARKSKRRHGWINTAGDLSRRSRTAYAKRLKALAEHALRAIRNAHKITEEKFQEKSERFETLVRTNPKNLGASYAKRLGQDPHEPKP